MLSAKVPSTAKHGIGNLCVCFGKRLALETSWEASRDASPGEAEAWACGDVANKHTDTHSTALESQKPNECINVA